MGVEVRKAVAEAGGAGRQRGTPQAGVGQAELHESSAGFRSDLLVSYSRCYISALGLQRLTFLERIF